ncbi:7840_t:CDS:2, partial [Racocetra persica]
QDDYLTDNGLCYAKVLLILQIASPKLGQKLELALVYWYDFAYLSDTHRHYFYKCAILKYVEHYTLIPIASITDI